MSCDWLSQGHVTRCSPLIGRSLAATLPFLLLSPALLQVWGEFGYDTGTGQQSARPPSEH